MKSRIVLFMGFLVLGFMMTMAMIMGATAETQILHNQESILKESIVIRDLSQKTSDRWTATDHREWAKERDAWLFQFIRLNPQLKYPPMIKK